MLSQCFSEYPFSRYRLPNVPFIIIFLAYRSNVIISLQAHISLDISWYNIISIRTVIYPSQKFLITGISQIPYHTSPISLRPYHFKLLYSIFGSDAVCAVLLHITYSVRFSRSLEKRLS